MKGIVLAGGTGTRLHPITLAVSKQLLPVSDKPMIYYPLSVLMLADIREILVITTPSDMPHFQRLLGDGSRLGLSLSYAAQEKPGGLAQAFIIGADFIGADPVALVLGDNIFHGSGFRELLRRNARDVDGCVLFGYPVPDPERYGVGVTDAEGRLVSLEEKPAEPKSDRAITGLYFYDNDVVDVAKNLSPSPRGELEITDVNRWYLERGKARLIELGRGFAWLDTGTPEALLKAGIYVQAMEERMGVRIACLEEVALQMGFIDAEACRRLGESMDKSPYGRYVMEVAAEAVGVGYRRRLVDAKRGV
ncbi:MULTISPECIES: glucose-1-phosphate thymidylyltransferase RfbA [Streptomyces]|uniref:Glucose-1-phosphate thymidylyltransferase n=2 Tax=Streptomyces TaxID=1883 RepID=A0ABS9J9P8_9ACTN|nr:MULTISPECIES: glucose-1-phosphate thymidylyltransferase RfbA [Streptomyces]MYU27715.1 glucose-1-phosphate thymidylyltransferase RfbA [Streptomyces sp. SID7810]CUW26579.1 Glucose-1-phosphate thymidylyltransferase 1 [Streptomyces reticuli]MCG0062263.1 glucose-1-phosphate thymidylyltransferase RfbA [Streptomyces tricolor]OYP19280.1 glucose-1-phosphate thymidylyltransferase [Streptomyces sp. FBKL.4005]BCM72067.1 glucose-1-phosphate thymidyltransferase [Streptomyces sp. EAS-AB2608]